MGGLRAELARGHAPPARPHRAVTAAVFAAVAVVLLASVWLFNPIPEGADCAGDEGYAAMKAHAEANGSPAGFALLFTGLSGVGDSEVPQIDW